ncbi:MAG: hypothetical protein MI922_18885 [Bacteroidales bacterium]|nr:hypothetical protein [Bacteroidales bacterium]
MNKCPNCNSKVAKTTSVCWNCQYSFIKGKVVDNNNELESCPHCNIPLEPEKYVCDNCGKEIYSDVTKDELDANDLRCLRCEHPMVFVGNKRIVESRYNSGIGFIIEMFKKDTSFDIYKCSNCNKVEFFAGD